MPYFSKAHYRSVIDNNIAVFNHGTTFNQSQLNRMCGTPDQPAYTDVRGAVHYLNLNKHLRPLGLYIKARNYYSEFQVLPLDSTQSRAVAYSGESVAKQKCSVELATGIQRYSSWNRMSPTERRAAMQSNWR
jgi:hypothetical protein